MIKHHYYITVIFCATLWTNCWGVRQPAGAARVLQSQKATLNLIDALETNNTTAALNALNKHPHINQVLEKILATLEKQTSDANTCFLYFESTTRKDIIKKQFEKLKFLFDNGVKFEALEDIKNYASTLIKTTQGLQWLKNLVAEHQRSKQNQKHLLAQIKSPEASLETTPIRSIILNRLVLVDPLITSPEEQGNTYAMLKFLFESGIQRDQYIPVKYIHPTLKKKIPTIESKGFINLVDLVQAYAQEIKKIGEKKINKEKFVKSAEAAYEMALLAKGYTWLLKERGSWEKHWLAIKQHLKNCYANHKYCDIIVAIQ